VLVLQIEFFGVPLSGSQGEARPALRRAKQSVHLVKQIKTAVSKTSQSWEVNIRLNYVRAKLPFYATKATLV
jgi:hypothetical protein